MKKKIKYRGYIIKIYFVGDATTRLYEFRLYEPRKYWFNKLVFVDRKQENEIMSVQVSCHKLIDDYIRLKLKWSV